MMILKHLTRNSSILFSQSEVFSGDLQENKSMVIHDTKCPDWDQVSLNHTELKTQSPFHSTTSEHLFFVFS